MFNLSEREVVIITAKPDLVKTEMPFFATDIINWIKEMNTMYSLPVRGVPCLGHERTEAFTRVLQKEVDESVDVIEAVKTWHHARSESTQCAEHLGENHPDTVVAYERERNAYLDALTAQADWLNDIIVYCLSEQIKLGLNPLACLAVIMQSNFSKLGADGKPILDADGKVEKGPNFRKPEPTLRALIDVSVQKANQL